MGPRGIVLANRPNENHFRSHQGFTVFATCVGDFTTMELNLDAQTSVALYQSMPQVANSSISLWIVILDKSSCKTIDQTDIALRL